MYLTAIQCIRTYSLVCSLLIITLLRTFVHGGCDFAGIEYLKIIFIRSHNVTNVYLLIASKLNRTYITLHTCNCTFVNMLRAYKSMLFLGMVTVKYTRI
jgi:hypothetical protein